MTSLTFVCKESCLNACDGMTEEEARNLADKVLFELGLNVVCDKVLINNKTYYDLHRKKVKA